MSKVAIQGNASGTGTFTIQSPATNTDRALTLPDEAGTVLTSASDIESQVKTATNATGTAPIYACRAWVNFSGTNTGSPRDSGNVSSITDNNVGDYTANFATAMPDDDFVATGSSGVSQSDPSFRVDTMTTTSVRFMTLRTSTNSNYDDTQVSLMVVR